MWVYDHRARNDRIVSRPLALDQNVGEDFERLLNKAPCLIFEMSDDVRVVNFEQGSMQVAAVAAAPFFPADETADFFSGEMNFPSNGTTVVGMFFRSATKTLCASGPG